MKRAISAILASSMILGISATVLSADIKAKEGSQQMVSVETEGIFKYNGNGDLLKVNPFHCREIRLLVILLII
ncbi:MAG: hypothetical protein HFE30_09060 [Clostridiales bacterium]|nr:hypothetical protein [Clostridiales bacterium]